jgi:CheY-like chemotaxis protein
VPKWSSKRYLVQELGELNARRPTILAQSPDRAGKMTVILVVEDEAIIRMETVLMLKAAGFEVLEAYNADIALKILESRTDISAVFTDIQMPGSLCGLKLAHAIRDRWPPIHLVVASGLKAPTQDEFPKIARFIRKPYAPEHVLKALQELLCPNPEPYSYFNDVIQNYAKLA